VIKLFSETLTHKSDVGGVRLDVRNATGVEEALAPYAAHSAQAELRGVGQATPVYFIGDRL